MVLHLGAAELRGIRYRGRSRECSPPLRPPAPRVTGDECSVARARVLVVVNGSSAAERLPMRHDADA